MPSMPRPKSRAARAAAALLSLSLVWQLVAPATYALAEEADEAPAAGEAMEEAPGQERPEVVGAESTDGGPADADAADDRADESEGNGDVPDQQEEEGADSTQDVPAESGPSGGLDPQLLSAAAPGDDPLAATVEHSGEWGECSWSIDSEGLLRIWPTDGVSGRLADSRGDSLDSATLYFPWYGNAHRVKRVVIDPGVSLPVDARGMFYGCSSLASLDVSGWDTSAVESMAHMFDGCSRLSSLDLSRWDTSSVVDMGYMFDGCRRLSSLDVSGWNTSRVADMDSMFYNCTSLASLDLSGWDTSSVESMYHMFFNCSSLASLDVSGWDTSSVTNMAHMFRGCSSLASLDVSGWDTSHVTYMDYMFYGCSSLASLDLSSWDTSSVKSMGYMFDDCSSLASLDVSGWDTSHVTYMGLMFYNCSSLSSLDVSGWDTSHVGNMYSMFYGCSSLASLDLSSWDTSSLSVMDYMFSGCDSLSRISVGERYDAAKAFPEAPGGGRWRSTATGRTYSAAEVASGRRLVADTYTLESYDLALATVDAIPDQAYTGKALKPKVTVRLGSRALAAGTDYTVSYSDNTNAGTATVTVTGRGDYTGTRTATFRVVPASLAKAAIATIPNQTHTGKALEPAVAVTLGGRALVAGTDYTVSYRDNTNAGTATVTVTGRGNYTGTRTATFRVVPASLAKAAIATIPNQTHTGKALEPAVAVTLGGRTLVAGTDYTVAYKDNTSVGTATVTVTGKGNYTGTAKATFEIVERPATVEVYRLYNGRTSEHLWTTSANEYKQLPVITKGDWRQEGIAWSAPDGAGTPVYRLYNKKMGDHYYSMDANEVRVLTTQHGWTVDNGGAPAFWSAGKSDPGVSPLFCVYNRRLKKGQHHFTADKNERDFLVANAGWRYEKEAFYGYVTKK